MLLADRRLTQEAQSTLGGHHSPRLAIWRSFSRRAVALINAESWMRLALNRFKTPSGPCWPRPRSLHVFLALVRLLLRSDFILGPSGLHHITPYW